jgi:hypothetical protein
MNDEILSDAEAKRRKKNAAQLAYYHKHKAKIASYQKQRRESNPSLKVKHREYCKAYNLRNPDKRKETSKKYYDANRAKCSKASVNSVRKSRVVNGDAMRAKQREYFANNADKWRPYFRQWNKSFKLTNRGKVVTKIRGRIWVLIKSNLIKTKRTYVDSIQILNWFEWLREKQIVDWTQKGIDIDHVLPISAFNLHDETVMKHINKWWNLFPMSAFENRSKGAKICSETFKKVRRLASEYIYETRANTGS